MITCTHMDESGAVCGAELIEREKPYLFHGDWHYKYTCTGPNKHKRVRWFSFDAWHQVHKGRGFGTNNKGKPLTVRPGSVFILRLVAAGYTPQEWWDYCESLDIPERK